MKSKLLQITKLLHLLYEWLCCSLCFAFFEVVLLKQDVHYFLLPITGAMFVYSYILREKAGHYVWLFAGHAVLRLPMFLLPVSMETQWFYFLIPCYLLGASVKSTWQNKRKQMDELPWPSFLLCLIVYLVSDYLSVRGLHIYAYVTALCLLFLYLALVYTDGMENYLDATSHVSGIPIRQILSVNTIMVGAIILCLTLGLVLGEVFDFRRVIALIGQAILAVVRVIAMVIGLFYHYISFWFRSGEAETSEHQEFDDGDVPAGIRSIGQTLEPVLYVGLICLGVFIAYKLLVRFVRFLMSRRNLSTDQVELVVIKKRKEEQRTRAEEKQRFLSRRQRARRCYKDCIERYRYDIALDQSKTGREIEKELSEQSLADVTELTRCYEDIRYGEAEVDRAMLQKMRRLSSR